MAPHRQGQARHPPHLPLLRRCEPRPHLVLLPRPPAGQGGEGPLRRRQPEAPAGPPDPRPRPPPERRHRAGRPHLRTPLTGDVGPVLRAAGVALSPNVAEAPAAQAPRVRRSRLVWRQQPPRAPQAIETSKLLERRCSGRATHLRRRHPCQDGMPRVLRHFRLHRLHCLPLDDRNPLRTASPTTRSATRSGTRSLPRNSPSMARLNSARSRRCRRVQDASGSTGPALGGAAASDR